MKPSPSEYAWQGFNARATAMLQRQFVPLKLLRDVLGWFDQARFALIESHAGAREHEALAAHGEAALAAVAAPAMGPVFEAETLMPQTGYVKAVADRADAAIAACPVLAPIMAEVRAWKAQQADMEARARATAEAQAEARAPAEIIAATRSRGIALAVDDAGNLTAPRGADLSPHELERLVRHKAAVVSLLRAEIEAAAPVVVA